MIHLLLCIGVADTLSSATTEKFGVAAGSSAENDTPGRALQTGKCCKRAAKHKRKKLQYKMKWQECEASADATPTCDYDSGEVFDGDACITPEACETEACAACETCEACEACATVETCGEPEEGKQFMFADVTAETVCGDLCALACFEEKTCGDPEDGKQFKDGVTAQTVCTTCETTCKQFKKDGEACVDREECISGHVCDDLRGVTDTQLPLVCTAEDRDYFFYDVCGGSECGATFGYGR